MDRTLAFLLLLFWELSVNVRNKFGRRDLSSFSLICPCYSGILMCISEAFSRQCSAGGKKSWQHALSSY